MLLFVGNALRLRSYPLYSYWKTGPVRRVNLLLAAALLGLSLAVSSLQAASRSLFFPHLISGMGFETRLTFTNPSSAPARIILTARSDEGALLTGNGIQNPATLTVPAHQQVVVEAGEVFHLPGNLLHLGWMQAESDNNQVVALLLASTSAQPTGAGIEASGALETALVGAIPAGLQSAVALANPNAVAAQVTLRLYDAAGQPRSQSSFPIPARGHQALFLNEGGSGAASPAEGGHFEIASSVGLSGLEVMTGLSGYTLAPLAAAGAGPFIFPRVVNGPDRSTTLVLENTAAFAVESRWMGFDLSRRSVAGTERTPIPISIPAHGTLTRTVAELLHLSPAENFEGLVLAEVTPGAANALEPAQASGLALFTQGTAVSSLPAQEGSSGLLLLARSAGDKLQDTSLHLLNPGGGPAEVTLLSYATDGSRLGSQKIALLAREALTVDSRLPFGTALAVLRGDAAIVGYQTLTDATGTLQSWGSRRVPPAISGTVPLSAELGGAVIAADARGSVNVPLGALEQDTVLTIASLTTSTTPPPSGMMVMAALQASPTGLRFRQAATLELPVLNSAPLREGTVLQIYNPETRTYQATNILVRSGPGGTTLLASISGFPAGPPGTAFVVLVPVPVAGTSGGIAGGGGGFFGGGGAIPSGGSGGLVTSSDGEVSVVVPPGAVPTSTNITITSVAPESLPSPPGNGTVLLAVKAEPSGMQFSTPVTLEFKVPTPLQGRLPKQLPLYIYNPLTKKYERTSFQAVLNAKGTKLTASVTHFTTFAVLQPYTPFASPLLPLDTPVRPLGIASVLVSAIAGTALTVTTESSLLGVNRSINGTVTLPTPAPAEGVAISLTSSDLGVATVSACSPATIPVGEVICSFTITGVALGPATITATAASGFDPGSTDVTVASRIISLGSGLVVAPSQSASLAVSLSDPAPAGGLTVYFESSAVSIATVTPSVFIPEGLTVPAANPQVTGVDFGTAQITASTVGFAPDTRAVTVSLVLSFSPTSIGVFRDRITNIILNLSSPAPPGGLTINLSTDSTAVATVPSTVSVGAGETSAQVPVTGVGAGSTTLRASATGVSETTASISLPTPALILYPGSTAVGKNLQTYIYGYLLAPAPTGNLQLTITSDNPAKMLLSTDPAAAGPGSGSITLIVPEGSSNIDTFYMQALVDNTGGTVQLTATADGYTLGTTTITLAPSGFVHPYWQGNFDATVGADDTTIYIYSARLNPSPGLEFAEYQDVRGGFSVNVPVSSSDTNVGDITPNQLVFSNGDSYQSAAFHAVAAGTTNITIGTPSGFSSPSNYQQITATVLAPSITLYPNSTTVGKNLQTYIWGYLSAPAPAGGLPVTIASADAAKMLLSTDPAAAGPGSGSITLTVPEGSSYIDYFYMQALVDNTGGTVQLTASAPGSGYTSGTTTITLAPSGFVYYYYQGNFNATVGAGDTTIYIYSARLNPSGLGFADYQAVRGGFSVSVPVSSSVPSVGDITPNQLDFSNGDSTQSTAFHAVAAGTTDITIGTPSGFSPPSNYQQIAATVLAPALTLYPTSTTVGKNLQTTIYASLSAPAPAGNLQVTIASADPAKLLLSTDPAAAGPGSGSIMLTVPEGNSSTNTFYMQALVDNTGGTVQLTASAPGSGYTSGTTTITLAPSGFVYHYNQGNISTTTFSTDTTIYIYSARLNPSGLGFADYQAVRGGFSVSVPVNSSDTNVGTITPSQPVFSNGAGYQTTAFHPLAAGITDITIGTPSGFSPPSNYQQITATVTAPPISISNATVGRDLQIPVGIFLDESPPSAVTVTVISNSSAVATLSTNGAVAGTNSVTFNDVTSPYVGTIYVQGRSLGNTTLTVQAPGYSDGTSNITVQRSGFIIYSPGNFNATVGGGDTTIYIVSVRLSSPGLEFAEYQAVRGGFSVNVLLNNSDSGVGTITPNSLDFSNGASTQTTAFHPVAPGTTNITVVKPSGFDLPSSNQQITATVQ